jgi:hypothetical protein
VQLEGALAQFTAFITDIASELTRFNSLLLTPEPRADNLARMMSVLSSRGFGVTVTIDVYVELALSASNINATQFNAYFLEPTPAGS